MDLITPQREMISTPIQATTQYRVCLACSAAVTISMLGWLLWRSNYGFDFTDESFYLVSIANPFIYSASVTQFGFIYHPLYEIINANISALRQINILITFGLAFLLCYVFIQNIFSNHAIAQERISSVILAAGFSCSSLIFFFSWPPVSTPSYNSLAFQALLLAGTGVLCVQRQTERISLAGWLLLGVGGWLAFMAKPTTAAALGLVTFIYLVITKKLNLSLLAISVLSATVLFLMSAWLIDGSAQDFMQRLARGGEESKMLGGGHSLGQLVRLDSFHLTRDEKALMAFLTAVFSTLLIITYSLRRLPTIITFFTHLIVTLFSLSIITELVIPHVRFGQFKGMLLCSILMTSFIASLYKVKTKIFTEQLRQNWAIGLCFLTFPHAFAFGTNNNYWQVGSGVGIFWVLAGLLIVHSASKSSFSCRSLLLLAAFFQLMSVTLIADGMENPYRQPAPLRTNDMIVNIGTRTSPLVLSREYGNYLDTLKHAAKNAGFVSGTPVIDLTGQSPGALYSIGAKSIAQAWMIGAYPGSDKLTKTKLDGVPCEDIANAWLLFEPDGPRSLSPEILKHFGIDLLTDFELVASISTPKGAGGFPEARKQLLLKPLRPNDRAVFACRRQRFGVVR